MDFLDMMFASCRADFQSNQLICFRLMIYPRSKCWLESSHPIGGRDVYICRQHKAAKVKTTECRFS